MLVVVVGSGGELAVKARELAVAMVVVVVLLLRREEGNKVVDDGPGAQLGQESGREGDEHIFAQGDL